MTARQPDDRILPLTANTNFMYWQILGKTGVAGLYELIESGLALPLEARTTRLVGNWIRIG